MEMSELSVCVGERSQHVSEVDGNVAQVDVGSVSRYRCFRCKNHYSEVAIMILKVSIQVLIVYPHPPQGFGSVHVPVGDEAAGSEV